MTGGKDNMTDIRHQGVVDNRPDAEVDELTREQEHNLL